MTTIDRHKIISWAKQNLTFKLIFHRFFPYFFLGGVLVLLLFFILGIWTYVTYVGDLATPEMLMNRNNTGLILTDRYDTVIYQSEGAKPFEPVDIEKIPKNLKLATVAVEDKDFYSHPGVSLPAILRSLATNIRLGTPTRYGGSTITQQLVKNALLTPEKSVKRKFQEALLAWEIDRRYTKEQILAMYLNSIYYGAGAYGISEASRIYFDKPVDKLTLSESAVLAALPQAPSALSPFGGDRDRLMSRKNTVLTKMVEQNYISNKEKEEALSTTVNFVSPPKTNEEGVAAHFALFVRDYLFDIYGEDTVTRRGFRVKTTLDLPLQKEALRILQDQINKLSAQHVSNGGVVTLNPTTGEVLVMIGSVDWQNETFGKYNVAFAKRQPGSSFKPIVYTLAFTKGRKTIDILHDQPANFSGYSPKNYDGKFRGDVTIRRALANSLNVPAVELLQSVGVNDSIELAKSMGITTLSDPNRYGLSLVLGGGEVELFEMTRAYGVLTTQGTLVPTHMILSIDDKLNNTLFTYDSATKFETNSLNQGFIGEVNEKIANYVQKNIGGNGEKRVLERAPTFITTNILKDNDAISEIFGTNSALRLSRPAAAKTGTTDSYRDAWTLGYTPDLVTGVWIGNNDNSPMGRVAGSIGAAPIWQQVMEKAHRGKPVRDFPVPSEIIEMVICKNGLLRACSECQDKYTEVFMKNNAPDNVCPEEITPTQEPTNTPASEVPTVTLLPPTSIPSDTLLPQPSPTAAVLTPTAIILPTTKTPTITVLTPPL